MKLYTLTESELLKVISNAQTYPKEEWNDFEILEALDLTPISLPSDEEINGKANSLQNEEYTTLYNEGINEGFYLGIEFMKEQILNQNK